MTSAVPTILSPVTPASAAAPGPTTLLITQTRPPAQRSGAGTVLIVVFVLAVLALSLWGILALGKKKNPPEPCAGVRCVHGVCQGGVCSCDAGYKGPSCEVQSDTPAGCAGVNCARNGTCVTGGVCRCEPGWSGPRCETQDAASVCAAKNCNAAANAGECIVVGGVATCRCKNNFYGADCTSSGSATECAALKCNSAHGNCEPGSTTTASGAGALKCVCRDGWTGDRCEIQPPATRNKGSFLSTAGEADGINFFGEGDFLRTADGRTILLQLPNASIAAYPTDSPAQAHTMAPLWNSQVNRPTDVQYHTSIARDTGDLCTFQGADPKSAVGVAVWCLGKHADRAGAGGNYVAYLQNDANLCVYAGSDLQHRGQKSCCFRTRTYCEQR
jgi:hypothetical protein